MGLNVLLFFLTLLVLVLIYFLFLAGIPIVAYDLFHFP
jgi:hypothetical protein